MKKFLARLATSQREITNLLAFKDKGSLLKAKKALRRAIASLDPVKIEIPVEGLNELLSERPEESNSKLIRNIKSILNPNVIQFDKFSNDGFIVTPVGEDFEIDVPESGKEKQDVLKVLQADVEEYVKKKIADAMEAQLSREIRDQPDHVDYRSRSRKEHAETREGRTNYGVLRKILDELKKK